MILGNLKKHVESLYLADNPMKELSSPRLIYTKIKESDFPLFYALHSHLEVMRYTYQDAHTSKEFSAREFKKILGSKDIHWIARRREDNEAIGLVGYYNVLNNESGGIIEMGYSLLPIFWGQGYGTEMGRSMIASIFTHTNIHKITGTINIQNIASQKILEKIGMTKEGVARKARYKNGEWVDELHYGILREEWENRNIADAL